MFLQWNQGAFDKISEEKTEFLSFSWRKKIQKFDPKEAKNLADPPDLKNFRFSSLFFSSKGQRWFPCLIAWTCSRTDPS